MQRTGHGERETDVRRKGTFIRYVDQVSPEARSKQSSQEVHSQIDPSTASSNQVRSHDALAERGYLVNSSYLFML